MADVVRMHGAAFAASRALTSDQRRALADIERCRTADLGAHVEVYSCGHEVVAYNSCRNRHCPKCLAHKAHEWVEQKERDLLDVPYFHVVFTLPQVLADLPPVARKALYEALFQASSSTLLAVGRRRLGGELGFLSVLHTWGQTLTHHPHVHCVVAGGALSSDRATWTASRRRFFLPVRVLSKVFRGKMLDALRQRELPGVDDEERECILAEAARREWVVYAKRPFGGPAQVLRYLARYTHRVAIGDRRIVSVDDDGVAFAYRDYRRGNASRTMKLAGREWLRRFVDHVLPRGFVRLRSYGFLANTKKSEKLAAIRALLGAAPVVTPAESAATATARVCPTCGHGLLVAHYDADLVRGRLHDTS